MRRASRSSISTTRCSAATPRTSGSIFWSGRARSTRGHIALLDQYYEDYGKGTLDIVAFLHFDFGALASQPRAKMEAWREEYLAEIIEPIILPKARELIASHEARGHVTAIVTAANSFLTAPIARMIGVEHLLASDPEIAEGEYTGKIAGIPCFHEGKIQKLEAWLASRGEALPDFPESCFYGDSQSDVPLMEKVTHPVAVGRTRGARADRAGAQLAGDFAAVG